MTKRMATIKKRDFQCNGEDFEQIDWLIQRVERLEGLLEKSKIFFKDISEERLTVKMTGKEIPISTMGADLAREWLIRLNQALSEDDEE